MSLFVSPFPQTKTSARLITAAPFFMPRQVKINLGLATMTWFWLRDTFIPAPPVVFTTVIICLDFAFVQNGNPSQNYTGPGRHIVCSLFLLTGLTVQKTFLLSLCSFPWINICWLFLKMRHIPLLWARQHWVVGKALEGRIGAAGTCVGKTGTCARRGEGNQHNSPTENESTFIFSALSRNYRQRIWFKSAQLNNLAIIWPDRFLVNTQSKSNSRNLWPMR